MTIFFAFIALILILKIFDRYLSKKQVVVILSTALILIFALKDTSVGPDTLTYINYYENWANQYADSEPGYYAIVNICRFFGLSSGAFLMVLYVFFIGSLGRFFYKYATDIYMSYMAVLSLGLIWNFIYILRQSIAACIIMIAFDFLMQKKTIRYVVLICFASLFHLSALLLLPFYWLVRLKLNKHFVVVFIGCSVGLLLIKNKVIEVVFELFPGYSNYLEYSDSTLSTLVIIETVAYLLICTYFYCKKTSNKELQNTNNVFIKSIYGYAVIVLFATLQPVLLRMNLYFFAPVSVMFPNVLSNESNKNRKQLIWFAAMVILILRFYITTRDNVYIFFWQGA